MPNIEQIIETYVLGWNSATSEQRMDLMGQALAENCVYFDSHLPEPTEGKDLPKNQGFKALPFTASVMYNIFQRKGNQPL